MLEYCIAHGDSLAELERDVDAQLRTGWTLVGGVAVAFGGEDFPNIWAQALSRPLEGNKA